MENICEMLLLSKEFEMQYLFNLGKEVIVWCLLLTVEFHLALKKKTAFTYVVPALENVFKEIVYFLIKYIFLKNLIHMWH